MPEQERARGVRIGTADVKRFRATVDMFAELDDRFGGGHAREALIQYLSIDADRMLSGRYSDAVGRELFSAVGRGNVARRVDDLRQRADKRAGPGLFRPGALARPGGQ